MKTIKNLRELVSTWVDEIKEPLHISLTRDEINESHGYRSALKDCAEQVLTVLSGANAADPRDAELALLREQVDVLAEQTSKMHECFIPQETCPGIGMCSVCIRDWSLAEARRRIAAKAERGEG